MFSRVRQVVLNLEVERYFHRVTYQIFCISDIYIMIRTVEKLNFCRSNKNNLWLGDTLT